MRNLLLLLAIPFFGTMCDDTATDAPVTPPATVKAETEEAVVRVDMGDRYRGPGVVVSSMGYVVTALSNLPEYPFWKYRVTVGSDRIPGRITAVDEKRGLALIKPERPFRRWATFKLDGVAERDDVVVVGHVVAESDPPLVTRRQIASEIGSVGLRAESSGDFDLRDAMTVSLRGGGTDGLHRQGSAVFSHLPDRFVGIVVGSTARDVGTGQNYSAPLFAASAKTVAAFLRENGVSPTVAR